MRRERRIQALEQTAREDGPQAWPSLLREIPCAKLKAMEEALEAKGSPSTKGQEIGRILVEGETEETLSRWWFILAGEHLPADQARMKFLE